MNPRLIHLELTDDDLLVWSIVLDRFRPRCLTWYEKTLTMDRADADLFFAAQRHRSYTFPVCLPPLKCLSSSGLEWLACGGALDRWATLNITHFA